MRRCEQIYVNGGWIPTAGTDAIEVFDSTNGQVIGTAPAGVADGEWRATAEIYADPVLANRLRRQIDASGSAIPAP